jgi:DNA-binding NarL/FixJ family response regulator
MNDPLRKQTIVIADPHAILREGLRSRLEQAGHLSVVAEVANQKEALQACLSAKPDILMVDFSILKAAEDGLLTGVRKAVPSLRVIILSDDVKVASAFGCLQDGAVSIMPRRAAGSDFVNASNAAVRGYTYIPNDLMAGFMEIRRNLSRSGNIFSLSARELEIVDSCVRGFSTREIARAFKISIRTVETHRSNIYRKTLCHSVEELLAAFGGSAA